MYIYSARKVASGIKTRDFLISPPGFQRNYCVHTCSLVVGGKIWMSHWRAILFSPDLSRAEPHSDTNSCLIVNQKAVGLDMGELADLPNIWRPRFGSVARHTRVESLN